MTAGEGGTLATCSKLLLPVAEQQGKEPTVSRRSQQGKGGRRDRGGRHRGGRVVFSGGTPEKKGVSAVVAR